MNALNGKQKIITALTNGIPATADGTHKLGEKALVYSVKHKKWIGLLIIINITGRMVTDETTDAIKWPTFNVFPIKLCSRANKHECRMSSDER